jgi:hypothetical protein
MIVLKAFNSHVRRFRVGDQIAEPKNPQELAELAPRTWDDLVTRKWVGEGNESEAPREIEPRAQRRK